MPPVALGGLGHRAVRRIGVGQGNGQELGLMGDEGIDHIYAGAGSDIVSGGADSDIIYGGQGADQISGDGGDDQILR